MPSCLTRCLPPSPSSSLLPRSSLPRFRLVVVLPRWDLLCFQPAHVVVFGVPLLAALPAAKVVPVFSLFPVLLFVKVPGAKNEETLLVQFPMCKKGDVVNLQMLAVHLVVREDLVSNFVFEKGLDMLKSRRLWQRLKQWSWCRSSKKQAMR